MIQTQFLNWVLDNKDSSLITLNNLTVDYFSDYKDEYNYIINHINQYSQVPDIETFVAKFPDFDLIKVTESPKYLINELLLDKQKRDIAKSVNNIRDAYNAGDWDKVNNIFKAYSEGIASGKYLESVDILKDTSRYNTYVERTTDFSKFYVKTGFKELDALIGGWDRNEELATIFARTGIGKSWALLKCAVAALEQGLNVGIYSGEMSENKVGYRIDTLISHISNRGMNQGDISIQPKYRDYIESLNNRYKGTIRVLTPTMISGPAGVNALRAFVEKDKLDILFIDQHSLLEDDRKGKTFVDKAANISKDLKNLQVMKKIPIITVSQGNRTTGQDENSDMLDTTQIAQSDRIGQDSTTIIGLTQKDGVLSLHLIKSRDSESKRIIQYAIDIDKGVFSYIPNENDALKGKDCETLKQEYDGEDVF